MGALSGRDPKETLLAVFTVLSRSSVVDDPRNEGLITLAKLISACKELKVRAFKSASWLSIAPAPPASIPNVTISC